jgi:hypothetical protein
VTITPVSGGTATVTVTATNSRLLSATQTIGVTVTVPPVPVPDAPLLVGTPPLVSFAYGVTTPQTLTLSDYVTGATSYEVESNKPTVASATESGGVLSITPGASGTASIMVTASNAGGDRSQNVIVDVAARPNMAPRLKSGKELNDIKMVTTNSGDNIKSYDLNDYFEDPDGILLGFKTTTSDAETVAVYETPAANVDAPTTTELDEADSTEAAKIDLNARVAGTATIMITVRDSAGLERTEMFVVTVVVDNEPPLPDTSNDLTDIQAAHMAGNRLKVGDTKEVTINYSDHFTDADHADRDKDDPWTLTAESDDKKILTVTYALTGKANSPDEVKITMVAVGGGTATVTIKATDSFGVEAMKSFMVQVNHRPQPYGAQADEDDRTTLAGYEGFMDMNVGAGEQMLPLTASDAGYFSDEDSGDNLTCDFRTSEATVAAADKTATVSMGANNTLNVTPLKIGTMTIDVWCNDASEDSETATVRVEIDRGA